LDQEEVDDPKVNFRFGFHFFNCLQGLKNRVKKGDPDAFNDVQQNLFKKLKKDLFSSFIMSDHGRRLASK
jgi:hypothetical protein